MRASIHLSARTMTRWRGLVLVVFTAVVTVVFGVLWVNMGGQLPLGITGGYRVTATLSDAQNLVYDSDVRIAGVRVGKVRDLGQEDGAVFASMEIRGDAHPLHEGATVRLRPKTLIEETYIEVTDGTGPALPDGARLPAAAEETGTRLDDLLAALDEPTRAALTSLATNLGEATEGHGGDFDATVAGLAALAREGHDPLDVLAAQSEDLAAMVAETAKLLGALDAGNGQLARLTTSAAKMSRATATRAGKIEEVLALLPGVLADARAAGPPLRALAGSLAPLAEPVRRTSPSLRAAAAELGPTADELSATYPVLAGVLGAAPATLGPAPGVTRELSAIIPPSRVFLADLNPMLAYLAPYGRDLTAFVANVAQVFNHADAAGKYVRSFVVLNDQSWKDVPSPTGQGPLHKSNAYPAPGGSEEPEPFTGKYPRVEEQP